MEDVEERRQEYEDMNRRFSLSHQLQAPRIHIDSPIRLLLSYCLDELEWATEIVVDAGVDDSGLVYVVVACSVEGKPANIVRTIAGHDFLQAELRHIAEVAELGERDTAWLLALPRVRRKGAGA